MSEDTESGLGVLQLVKMHAAGQISLELFKQLAANVVGYHEELPIVVDEPPAAETHSGSSAAAAASSSSEQPDAAVNTFDEDQTSALADYIELSLQKQFNARSRKPQ